MFKFRKVIDRFPEFNDELATYVSVPGYFIIHKWHSEKKYSLWYNPNEKEKKRFNFTGFQFLKDFDKLKEAKEYAYHWYLKKKNDNLCL